MEFWKKFYNQPMLWGLAFAMVLGLGLFVYKTPNLLMIQGGGILFGQWVDISVTSYAEANPKSDHNFFVDIMINYPRIGGVTFVSRDDASGEIMSQGTAKYNFWAGLSLVTVMLLLVVYATRKSKSAIFILGPLFAFLIISMIVSIKTDDAMSAYEGYTVSVNVGDAIFNWALMFGGTAMGVYFVVKHVINKGLVRGIDQDGPLDLSRLKDATMATAGNVASVVGGIGNKLQQAIGDDNVLPTSPPVPPQPIVSQFKIRKCIACGCDIKNSKCSICLKPTSNYVIDPLYGFCQDCHAPKAMGASRCYSCGALFENDGEPIYSNQESISLGDFDATMPIRYCSECGSTITPGDGFCSECGKSTAAVQSN